MTLADILLIVAILGFLVAWWNRRMPARGKLLIVFASLALLASLWDVFDDRWQAIVGVVASLTFLAAIAIGRWWGKRTGVPYITGPLFTLYGAAAIAALILFPVWRLPTPSGKHAVGVRTFELDDASRPHVFTRSDGPRRLLVRVWYPAEPVAGATPRYYFDEVEAKATARTMGSLLGFEPLLTYIKHVRTNAYEDAPLLSGAQQLPTIFYSHGYTSFLAQNSALCEDLASHGYVVYSVQHTYDSSATAFADGSVAEIDPDLLEADRNFSTRDKKREAMVQGATGPSFDKRLQGQLEYAEASLADGDRIRVLSPRTWVADQLFVHDRLQAGEVPEPIRPLAAACDLTRTGEMGMSFGGATAGVISLLDPRCVAAINLDGGDFHFLAFNTDMRVPFLMLHSDIRGLYNSMDVTPEGEYRSFNDFSYETFAHAGAQENVHRVEIKESQHLGLSDFTLFMRRPLRDALLGSTPTDVMIGAQNDLVREFFDKYLRGKQNDFPEDQFRKYADWVVPYKNEGLRDWWLAKPEAERADIERRISELKTKVNWEELRPKPLEADEKGITAEDTEGRGGENPGEQDK
jgi:predicted dienelactone hydrolase